MPRRLDWPEPEYDDTADAVSTGTRARVRCGGWSHQTRGAAAATQEHVVIAAKASTPILFIVLRS